MDDAGERLRERTLIDIFSREKQLTLPLERDGERVLAVRVADRAVVLAKVGGDHVADHQRAAHPVRPAPLLHPVVTTRRARHLLLENKVKFN